MIADAIKQKNDVAISKKTIIQSALEKKNDLRFFLHQMGNIATIRKVSVHEYFMQANSGS